MKNKNLLKIFTITAFLLFVTSCSSEDSSEIEEVLTEKEATEKKATDKEKKEEQKKAEELKEKIKKREEASYKTITSEGIERKYTVRVPKGYTKETAVPLVFALHGRGGSKEGMEKTSKFTDLIDQENFIVVYPQALLEPKREGSGESRTSWTLGRTLDNGVKYDDILFLRAVRNQILTEYNIDQKKVFLAGLSNGAFFANSTSIFLPNEFAALGSFAGSYFKKRKVEDPEDQLLV